MKTECIAAVAKALGRAVTKAEGKKIEEDIQRHMRLVARRDINAWRSMSRAERLYAGVKSARDEFLGEARRKAENTSLQILANGRNETRLAELRPQESSHAAALVRRLAEADTYRKGVEREAFSDALDTIKAAEPKFFGLFENPEADGAFVREVMGEKTGNDVAARGAKAWRDVSEGLRQRFNRAGGNIRKLAGGYLPQVHDVSRVRRVPAVKWAAEILPTLDRTRYLNTDGSPLNDQAMLGVLMEIHESIATNGINDLEPGQHRGTQARANRRQEHRELHFKDADGWIGYHNRYGRGGIFELMRGHIASLARDIALVEQFGPNADATFRFLSDSATKADGSEKLVGPLLVRPKDVWSVLTGLTGQAAHQGLAGLGSGVRNFEAAVKLGSTFLSSFTDAWTTVMTANYNRMGVAKTLAEVVRGFGGESKEFANRAGLIAESVVGDMTRFSEAQLSNKWPGKLANFTMRAGLVNAWSDALRRGFSVSLMGSLGKLTRGEWAAMGEIDRKRLEQRGVDQRLWSIWREAKPEDWRNSTMLTPEAVRAIPDGKLMKYGDPTRIRDEAASKLLGFIIEESEYAVVNRDITTAAALTRSTQAGTLEGEFLRSLFLFKSFPMAMISRHMGRIRRMANEEGMSSATAQAASLVAGLWLFGALSLQAKSLAVGQDPRDVRDPRFWFASFVQGGGLGIYGDIISTGVGGNNRGGVGNWASLLGPVFGDAAQVGDLVLGNIGEAVRGKETDVGAESVRLASRNLPLANLWYAKAVFQHMVMHNLQDWLSPGYLSRMRNRAQRDFGTQYWWEPGEMMPDRGPNLAAAVGE